MAGASGAAATGFAGWIACGFEAAAGSGDAGFFDEIQAVRQQAFADGEAREVLALDDQYIMAFAFEQGSRDCTGGPGTNHHHLTTFHIYY